MTKEKAVGRPRSQWFVEFPRKFRDREQFFWVIRQLDRINGTQFSVRVPDAAAIREGKTAVLLVGSGMIIEVKSGATPLEITESRVAHGYSGFADRDWWIGFEKFPDLKVKLYRHRGRPRNELRNALVQGKRAEGKSWKKVSKELGLANVETSRYYRKRARAGLKDRESGRGP